MRQSIYKSNDTAGSSNGFYSRNNSNLNSKKPPNGVRKPDTHTKQTTDTSLSLISNKAIE